MVKIWKSTFCQVANWSSTILQTVRFIVETRRVLKYQRVGYQVVYKLCYCLQLNLLFYIGNYLRIKYKYF
jgi:hypothetical protein